VHELREPLFGIAFRAADRFYVLSASAIGFAR